MISLKEVYDKTEYGRKLIRQALDRGCIGPEERASFYTDLNREDYVNVKETVESLQLSELLAKSGALTSTPGLQGSNYLVALKIFDVIASAVRTYDLCPLIAARMVPRWDGADLKVNVAKDNQFITNDASSGGRMPEGGDEFVTPIVLTPTLITSRVDFGNDTLEDSGPDVFQYHIERCGQAHGLRATSQALTALIAANTGDGTKNTVTASSDETTHQQIQDGCDENGRDDFISDTLIVTSEAYSHSIHAYAVLTSSMVVPCVTTSAPAQGFHFKMNALDVLLNNNALLHASTDIAGAAFTDCKSLVFDRKNALIVVRKRWLQLERFGDPIKDLSSMVVTSRQACATLYDDAVCVITES